MSIEIQKPAPLQLGDRYFFTLTSYEPVSIEIDVPYITDVDVDYALATVAQHSGKKLSELDDAWAKENFEGAESLAQVRESLHDQLVGMNDSISEDAKPSKCATELAKRLVQAVPAEMVSEVRQSVEQSFAMELAQQGLTLDTFLARSGANESQLSQMFDQEAQAAAEQDAALDAYAQEKKLKVDDTEIPALIGASPEEAAKVIAEAKAHGQMELLRTMALRSKASRVVVAECSCSYHHETADEAAKRVEEYSKIDDLVAAQEAADGNDSSSAGTDAGASGEFKLV